LIPERQSTLPDGTTYLLVVRPAAVFRRLCFHIALRRTGRCEALTEVLAGCEGGCIHLNLEMALVLVPVADLDCEHEQQKEERQE